MTERDHRCTVAAKGQLDRSTAELLDRAIRAAEATTAREVVVDLSPLEFMDTSGLHLILKAHARSQADSNRLSLVRGRGQVQRVFELTGTERLLPFKRLTAGDLT